MLLHHIALYRHTTVIRLCVSCMMFWFKSIKVNSTLASVVLKHLGHNAVQLLWGQISSWHRSALGGQR